MRDVDAVKELDHLIDQANRIVFFGGAGVSTESGVPDFRGGHGIYKQHIGAESILTPGFMRTYPDEFWAFYRHYFMLEGIKPNAAHKGLAALEKEGKLSAIITQNVDGLHQEAGSKNVIELHGNGNRFYCLRCSQEYSIDEVRGMDEIPHCHCGGDVRPDIVLYQESLDQFAITSAIDEIENCDLLIVGGTSLSVYPAAGLIRYQQRGKLVMINKTKTSSDAQADLRITKPIGEVFESIGRLRGYDYVN